MMQRSFPRALVACISQNRRPRPHEVEVIAEKFWREALGSSRIGNWQDVGPGSPERRKAVAVAHAAVGWAG